MRPPRAEGRGRERVAAAPGARCLGRARPREAARGRARRRRPRRALARARAAAADIEIQAKEILFIRALLCEYIADYTGQARAGGAGRGRRRGAVAGAGGSGAGGWGRAAWRAAATRGGRRATPAARRRAQPVEKIEEDCDRDFFMTPEEAKATTAHDGRAAARPATARPPPSLRP